MPNADSKKDHQSARVGSYSIVLGVCWTCTVIVSLVWNLHLQNQETTEVARNVARAYIQSDNSYRRWNALQGGIYIPAKEKYSHKLPVDVPEQEIITPSGKHLVLTSHALMMDEIYELVGQDYIARGELRSLESSSNIRKADEWETAALNALLKGEKEVGEVVSINGVQNFFLMQPYIIEKPCLKCHAGEGYEIGDVRGGITVRIPLSKFGIANLQQLQMLKWGHLLWWFLGILGIAISYYGMRSRIIERQQVEAALNKLRKQQEQILTAAGEGIYGVDKNGITTFVNPAAAKMLGWNAKELIGRSQHYTIHHTKPDGSPYPEEECPISGAIKDGQTHSGTDEIYFKKDGTRFPVDYISTPVIENGEIMGAVITFADVSARKKAEADVAKAQMYLQNIINAMPSALIGIDIDGHVNQLNNEAMKMVGLEPENAYGKQVEEVCPMLADKIVQINQALEQQNIFKFESVYCVPEKGAGRYTDIIIYPLSLEDYQGAVIRIDDVTERVLMEDRLVQSEKMTSVVGLVEGMAHEINNPLGGIIQGAQNVMRRLSPELPRNIETAAELGIDLKKVQNYLDERQIPKFLKGIRSSGKRAADIVSYMLQFSQVHQAPKELRNLERLFDSIIETLISNKEYREKYHFDSVEIVKEYDPGLPEVPCISSEIEQVMRNLIRNAAQALSDRKNLPENPKITLRIKHEAQMNLVVIEVEDNGQGMDETVQRRVFEPFFTTKPPGEGTGLGLAVSYFLITVAHQGLMDVESEPGKGTIFSIRLPLS
ncbi:PAS domain S-box protein [Thermodesulfobacteriota bacterium]